MKYFIPVILSLMTLLIVVQAGKLAGLWNYTFWQPKYEDAKREVFTHTTSFVQGMTQDFNAAKLQYHTTQDEDVKNAIRSMVLHRAGQIDNSLLPLDLETWIKELKNPQGVEATYYGKH